MWVFIGVGFFSVVQDKSDAKRLMVRTRIDGDLEALRTRYLPELTATLKLAGSDYPYRAFCLRPELAAAMVNVIFDIDYTNFKNMVMDRQSLAREKLYAQVWSVMSHAEEKIKQLENDDKRWKESWKDKQGAGWYDSGYGGTSGYGGQLALPIKSDSSLDTPPARANRRCRQGHHLWIEDQYGVYCRRCQKNGTWDDLYGQKGLPSTNDPTRNELPLGANNNKTVELADDMVLSNGRDTRPLSLLGDAALEKAIFGNGNGKNGKH